MYKLKQGVNLPKEFKIKVNPKQSEALQLHLFSIGKTWFNVGKKVQYYGDHYIYCHSHANIGQGDDKEKFKSMFTDYPRIKFKDYFEKVTNQFPEKWCIEVTQDNYKELNVWMHRNWKNYEGYTDLWQVTNGGYFMSEGNLHHTEWDIISGFTLITTEQFRKQFGIIEAPENWQDKAIHYKQRCKDLRLERYEMSKELETYKSVIRKIESNLKNMFIPF